MMVGCRGSGTTRILCDLPSVSILNQFQLVFLGAATSENSKDKTSSLVPMYLSYMPSECT